MWLQSLCHTVTLLTRKNAVIHGCKCCITLTLGKAECSDGFSHVVDWCQMEWCLPADSPTGNHPQLGSSVDQPIQHVMFVPHTSGGVRAN